MKHRLILITLLAILVSPLVAQIPSSPADAALLVAAGRKQAQLIDLSQPLEASSTFYPALFAGIDASALPMQPRNAVKLGRKVFPGGTPFNLDPPRGARMPSMMTGEHTGTHMDAPNHFVPKAGDIAEHPVDGFIRPLAVIDVREPARSDPKLHVTIEMLQQWETRHGRIQPGAMVCILTGYERRAGDTDTKHPGFTPKAADWLRRERGISGVGTDSLSPDVAGAYSFPVHKRLLKDGCMILENVRNLDRAPANGARVLMAPMPITTGSGSPTRVVAIQERADPRATPPPAGSGSYRTIDLTHPLDEDVPFVRGQDPVFEVTKGDLLGEVGKSLGKELFKGLGLGDVELDLSGGAKETPFLRETTARTVPNGYYGGYFEMGVSTGTHIQFPRTSSAAGMDAASYPLERLIGGCVVVDLRDVGTRASVSAADLERRLRGASVSGAFVVLQTGRLDGDQPGLSVEATQWLMARSARGILSDGASPAAAYDPRASEVLRLVHEAYGITGGFLLSPGRLPVSGATLAVLPMPVRGSPAAPARIFATVPQAPNRPGGWRRR